jgi:hypothetical protein
MGTPLVASVVPRQRFSIDRGLGHLYFAAVDGSRSECRRDSDRRYLKLERRETRKTPWFLRV